MQLASKQNLLDRLYALQAPTCAASPKEFQEKALEILRPLMQEDGYEFNYVHRYDPPEQLVFASRSKTTNSGFSDDFSDTIAIECGNVISRENTLDAILQTLNLALQRGCNRALIVSGRPLPPNVLGLVARDHPADVQILDLNAIENWIQRARVEKRELIEENQRIVVELARKYARLVAASPEGLQMVEWRDLERVIAEIFEKIGFKVELSRSAKDGGWDVGVTCRSHGTKRSYLIEIKHWICGDRVGRNCLSKFVKVILSEGHDGGLFLSSSGFVRNSFEALTKVEREVLHLGDQRKIRALCRTYVRVDAGILIPHDQLVETLFEDTDQHISSPKPRARRRLS